MANTELLEQDAVVVEQVRKLFEMRSQYGLFATDGRRIGQIEQVEQSPFQVLLRFFSDLDVALPTTLAIEDAAGEPLLRLHKPWFRWEVQVERADGTPIGRIRKRVRLGKARFTLVGPTGAPAGEVHAQNWRARNFTVNDPGGRAVATVTKKWRGLATEMFTDADTYVVELGSTTEPMRSLALAAALAVDVVMKQKDY